MDSIICFKSCLSFLFPIIQFCQCSELMCKEGLQSLFPMEEIAIMGLWELLPHIYSVKVLHWCVPHALLSVCMMHLTLTIVTLILQRKIENTVDAAVLFQPHAVVTVDSKGFSFRLLKQLKCKDVKNISIFRLYLKFISKHEINFLLSRQKQSKGSTSTHTLCFTIILGLERW